MRDLIIIGAGGSSRDIIELVEDINHDRPSWTLCGVVDDDPARHGTTICDIPVIGSVDKAAGMQAALVIGIASHRNRLTKRRIVERLGADPARYATLIHPTASLSPRASVGHGTVLLHHVVVAPQVRIGHHVLVSAATIVGHDAMIGDCVTMAPQVCISGNASIEADVYIGAAACLREGVTVGQGSLVGIGSLVLTDVEPGRTVFGHPARAQ